MEREVRCIDYETLTTVVNIYQNWYKDFRLNWLLPAMS